MELREIESEVAEQRDDVADISLEVETHKAHAERLEAAVHALLEAHAVVQSDGVQRAIDHAMDAKYATDNRLSELRMQKEDLLERNHDLQERCGTALDRKRYALEKLPVLHWAEASTLKPGDPSFSLFASMSQMVHEAIAGVEAAYNDLRAIQSLLEGLPI